MKIVVITGSTRGIGLGLAKSFLDMGCTVTISGRSDKSVQAAIGKLSETYPDEKILGHPCDVTKPNQVQGLWDGVANRFGRVDIWINNAGVSGPQAEVWKYTPDQARSVIQTNMLGTVYGARVAINGMIAQGSGAIYNLEGMGSNGRIQPGMALYGTTKAGVHYFTRSLAKELEETAVIVGSLQPGMVVTDLIMKHYKDDPDALDQVKGIFNIIADRVETVTPWLAREVLKNEKSGKVIAWGSRWKSLWRFLTAPFTKRDLFNDL